jgi:tRNA nucleotidyltransferase (CCA-adding enzyme)
VSGLVGDDADDETHARERLRRAIPPHVRVVCERLVAAGHEAVTVGGAVRDAILGRVPGDWDVATSAHPDEVRALFDHTIPTGLAHGTITVVTGKGVASHVEVTTFRGEGAYTDARRPDHVRFGVPLVEDLARRDLRVNAIAYDPARDRLIDPYAGRSDLRARLLRAVGPTGNVYQDAVARFTEDGLRVMRAVRFAAQLEFALDPDTERGISPALPSLAKVSKERICEELRKILAAPEPSRALVPAERTGILALILPELGPGLVAWGTTTDSWAASVDAAPRTARLGTLLAPLAPPSDTRRSDRAVQKRAVVVLRGLKFSNDEIAIAAGIVGAAGAAAISEWTEAEVRLLLADAGRAHAPHVVESFVARGYEVLANLGGAILARGDALTTGELAVTGADLMRELDLPPGPALGRLLAQLLERALADPACNTRDRLLELARAALAD